jgi:uncharacterized damage-inducible protein DinB
MTHRKRSVVGSLLVLLIALSATPARAHEPAPASPGVKAEMTAWIVDAEDKLMQLAATTPEEKYAWRPSKDVRSTGEVFMHVVTANYGIPSFWGVKPPAGFDFMSHEKSLTKKADIEAALKASFAHMKGALAAASDADLDKPTEFFGMKSTVRGGYLLLLSHAHEHLGQSIAYARMNGITPPWTIKQQEAMKAMEEKKKAEAK